MRLSPERLDAFVAALPKTEVHLHLEGAVPWRLVRQWNDGPLPENPPHWERRHRFDDFQDFVIAMRDAWKPQLTSLDRLAQAAGAIYQDRLAQNVRYLEMSFGLAAHRYSVAEVVDALKRDAPRGLTVRIIGGVSRDRDVKEGLYLGTEAIETESLDGLDLHGDERKGHLKDFAILYERARERGKITKAHAGELTGPEAVRDTIERLGVSRIEHGIGAARDGSLVAMLRDRGVALGMCPWSNVKLCLVPDLARHPIKAMHRAGVQVTANTDDPTVFGQTITDEYRWLHSEVSLSVEEVGAIAANGFRIAKMDDDERAKALAEIAQVVSAYQGVR